MLKLKMLEVQEYHVLLYNKGAESARNLPLLN
jgi:hypothetical protein